jgi:hypothetical protein
MSPEQASGKSVDRRSDVFSRGTVAYELLTGVRPFEGSNDLDTLERVRTSEILSLVELVPELSGELEAAVLKALEKDVGDRYAEAVELGSALLKAVADLDGADEDAMSTELSRLFPGAEEALAAFSSGMRLDEALALEADRMLFASPQGESPTMTSTARADPKALDLWSDFIGRGGQRDSAPQPVATPYPQPQLTPSPRPQPLDSTQVEALEEAAAPGRRRVLSILLASLVAVAVIAALLSSSGVLGPTRLRVICNEPHAEILVDNTFAGVCPLTIDQEPGTHQVTARLAGFESATVEVVVERGMTNEAQLELFAVVVSSVRVRFFVTPSSAQFFLDGNDGRWMPQGSAIDVVVGEHSIQIEAPGHLPHRGAIEITSDMTEIQFTLEEAPGAPEPDVVEAAPYVVVSSTEPAEERTRLVVVPSEREAMIVVDGRDRRIGENTLRFSSGDPAVTIEARLDGFTSERVRFDPSDDHRPRRIHITLTAAGQMRLVLIRPQSPAFVDDVYFGEERVGTSQDNYRLRTGRTVHIRVYNQTLDRWDEETVTIPALEDGQSVDAPVVLTFFR